MATKIIKFKGGNLNNVNEEENVEKKPFVIEEGSDDEGSAPASVEGSVGEKEPNDEGSAPASVEGSVVEEKEEEDQVGGRRHKKKTVQFEDEDSDSDDSICTVDLLSKDPLFLVLSHFFISKESGDNIATVLEKLNNTLEKMGSSRP